MLNSVKTTLCVAHQINSKTESSNALRRCGGGRDGTQLGYGGGGCLNVKKRQLRFKFTLTRWCQSYTLTKVGPSLAGFGSNVSPKHAVNANSVHPVLHSSACFSGPHWMTTEWLFPIINSFWLFSVDKALEKKRTKTKTKTWDAGFSLALHLNWILLLTLQQFPMVLSIEVSKISDVHHFYD